MVDDTPLERQMKENLATLGNAVQADLSSLYDRARIKLFSDVLPYIRGAENSLTDHSEHHIVHVLKNANLLIFGDQASEEEKRKRLNPAELYLLCLSILFHDVGNVFGRTAHERRVGEIYDEIRRGERVSNREKPIVVKITRAHTGKTRNGSSDTLEELADDHFYDQPVNLRQLGAILRFADELAEGKNRTSAFMLEHSLFDPASEVYHRYATTVDPHIDRGGERISLRYVFPCYEIDQANELAKFEESLRFTYSRIFKLDAERKYCKYFSPLLSPFKQTLVNLSFWVHANQDEELSLPEICLTDKLIPGQIGPDTGLESLYPDYSVEKIRKKLVLARTGVST